MTPKVGQLALNENCALVDLKKCKWRVSLDVENEENLFEINPFSLCRLKLLHQRSVEEMNFYPFFLTFALLYIAKYQAVII